MSEPYKKQKIETFGDEEEPSIPIRTQTAELSFEAQSQVDQSALLEQYMNVITYKNHLFKIELLLQNEDAPETIEELNSMKEQLIPAIQVWEDNIKQMQNSTEFQFSVNRIKSEDANKLCKAYYESSKRWFNARIINVNVDEQTAEIQFIGNQDTVELSAVFIKVSSPPDASLFPVGCQCEAIFPGDGRYYPCQIEKITPEGYLVKFKKYNNREIVSIYYLREPKKSKQDAQNDQKKMFENLDEFKVPDNLKILPSDNEQQRQAKKKKLKAMKQAFKQAQFEKYSCESKNSWQSFNQKQSQVKPDIGQKAASIFRTPDNPTGKSVVLVNQQKVNNLGGLL